MKFTVMSPSGPHPSVREPLFKNDWAWNAWSKWDKCSGKKGSKDMHQSTQTSLTSRSPLTPVQCPSSPHSPSVLFRRRSSSFTSRAIQPCGFCWTRAPASLSKLAHRSLSLETRNDRVVRTQKRAISVAFAIHNQQLWIDLKYVYYRLPSNRSGKNQAYQYCVKLYTACPPRIF